MIRKDGTCKFHPCSSEWACGSGDAEFLESCWGLLDIKNVLGVD